MSENQDQKWLDKIKNNIDELSTNITGMFDSLEIISQPIKESSKNMPVAADHLNKITKQTELATNQILDKLENMTDRDSEALEIIANTKEHLKDGRKDNAVTDAIDKLDSTINDDLNDVYLIMESLQFQDITSQRIGFITSLIEDVENKLNTLLSALGEITKLKVLEKNDHFDPDAEYSDSAERQEMVDKIINAKE